MRQTGRDRTTKGRNYILDQLASQISQFS